MFSKSKIANAYVAPHTKKSKHITNPTGSLQNVLDRNANVTNLNLIQQNDTTYPT